MVKREKAKVQELIDYWKNRADALILDFTKSATLGYCARELEKLLNNKPTEANGFKPPSAKRN